MTETTIIPHPASNCSPETFLHMILEHIEQVESIVVSVEYKPEAGGNLRTFNTATTAAVMAFHMFVIKEHLEEEIRKGGSSNAEHNENVAS